MGSWYLACIVYFKTRSWKLGIRQCSQGEDAPNIFASERDHCLSVFVYRLPMVTYVIDNPFMILHVFSSFFCFFFNLVLIWIMFDLCLSINYLSLYLELIFWSQPPGRADFLGQYFPQVGESIIRWDESKNLSIQTSTVLVGLQGRSFMTFTYECMWKYIKVLQNLNLDRVDQKAKSIWDLWGVMRDGSWSNNLKDQCLFRQTSQKQWRKTDIFASLSIAWDTSCEPSCCTLNHQRNYNCWRFILVAHFCVDTGN